MVFQSPPSSYQFLLYCRSGKILTQDNLCKRGRALVSGCPFCLGASEDVTIFFSIMLSRRQFGACSKSVRHPVVHAFIYRRVALHLGDPSHIYQVSVDVVVSSLRHHLEFVVGTKQLHL